MEDELINIHANGQTLQYSLIEIYHLFIFIDFKLLQVSKLYN